MPVVRSHEGVWAWHRFRRPSPHLESQYSSKACQGSLILMLQWRNKASESPERGGVDRKRSIYSNQTEKQTRTQPCKVYELYRPSTMAIGEGGALPVPPPQTTTTSRMAATRPYQNLHHKKKITIRATPPRGAYCRSIAWKLMFFAARRYFSDSVRREVERCDISGGEKVVSVDFR